MKVVHKFRLETDDRINTLKPASRLQNPAQ